MCRKKLLRNHTGGGASLKGLQALLLLSCLALTACDAPDASPQGPQYSDQQRGTKQAIYRLAVHPLHNPRKLSQSYQPLIDYLNREISDVTFELEASRDYSVFEAKYQIQEPELLLANPWQTLQAIKADYRVIAMAGDAADFKGIFLVNKESAIRKPADLHGKVISYPAPTSLAACIMPQYFLHQAGIDVNKDIVNRYVGSQESSIMNVVLHQTDVAATWPPPWRAFQKDYPAEAAKLKVIWETPALLNNSVMVRDDLPAEVVERLRTLLLGLHTTAAGRDILAGMETARFHPATNKNYDVVRDFIRRFEAEVRKVQ